MNKVKAILFSLLILFGFTGSVMGQTTLLTDDFEAGNLNNWTDGATGHWEASATSPINGTYSLKHALSNVESESFIYSSITATDVNTKVTTWQFNMKNGSWDPSGGNDFSFMLMGNESDPASGTLNGYVVGVHYSSTGTDDFLILWKVTNGSATAIITSSFDWGSGDLVGIKVERNSSGNWQLFYDTDGDFDNLTLAGSAIDTDHTTYSHSAIFFDYTSTRAGEFWVDDILIQQNDETTKAEPEDHPLNFTATGSVKSIDLSWTDVSSSPTPDGYLIKANNTGFGSITDPADETAEADDTDLSDGSAVLNVLQGTQEAFFSGLDGETTYYFKIYPYTNSGSDINYKMDGSVPQVDVTTSETPPIVLNEFLADPDPTTGDANGDGTVSSDDDEFLEFVNNGSSNLDISNWTIEDAGSTTHTFDNPTVLKPLQAVVVFGGGTPTGDFGGAITQTTGSLSLNNTGDSIILKNDSGVEIINYTYGSEGGNDESITRNADLTGGFVAHETADTDDASSFSSGTRIDGTTFQPSVSIIGNEGWRILSTPTSGNTYDDLLADIWTQGITSGADATGGTPNVQSFNGSDFVAVNDLTTPMTTGEGFIVYVYSDDDHTESEANAGFPKRLDLFGSENTGTVIPTLTSGADEWTLVGNPYNSTIGWDGLTKTDLTETVYVYDHSNGSLEVDEQGGNAGSYRTWNGTSGSLTDGLIAPFQGFWVQNASSGTPSLTIDEADKTTGGTFYKESADESISIKLRGEMENMFSEAYLSFTEHGEIGKDNFDGLKLEPLDFRNYLSLSTITGDEKLDINNLPNEFEGEIKIPVSIQAFQADMESVTWIEKGGEVQFTWPEMKNIPEDWSVTLQDYEAGQSVNMMTNVSYGFIVEGSQNKVKSAPQLTILNPQPPQVEMVRKSDEQDPRFVITIMAETSVNNEPTEEPKTFTLEQNYPNPFNPVTQIEYSLANAVDVTLAVYNIAGQLVETLVNERKSSGTYRVSWDAANMASGIYYYRLQAGNQVLTRQMTLIK